VEVDDVCVEVTQGLSPVVAVQRVVTVVCCVPENVEDAIVPPSHPALTRQMKRKIQVMLMSRIVPLNQSKNSRRPGMSSHQRRWSRGVKTEVQKDEVARPIGDRWRLTMRLAIGERAPRPVVQEAKAPSSTAVSDPSFPPAALAIETADAATVTASGEIVSNSS
jgi:hypothetical protein